MSLPPMTRRSLLAGSGIAVIGAVAGFVVARNSGAAETAAPGTAANAYGDSGGAAVLAAVADIGNGIVAKGVVLTRDPAGMVHGVSAVCTHEGCTVSKPDRGVVHCPCHGSEFDAATGKVLRGPAARALPAVPVRVEGSDVVRG